jgi:hypothetical protein
MKRMLIVGALVSLLYNIPAVAAQVSLKDVRYSAQSGSSRVTLVFDGEVRYSPVAAEGSIRLGLSNTSVAVPAKARRQLLSTGLASSITITTLPDDSVVVVVALKAPATYRCILPASGNSLYVDIIGTGGGAAVQRTARDSQDRPAPLKSRGATMMGALSRIPARPAAPKSTPVSAKSAEVASGEPGRSTSVVDISAILREQMHSDMSQTATRQQVNTRELSPVVAVTLSVLIVLVLSGSGLALAFVFRKRSVRAVAPPRPAPPAPQAEPPVDSLPASPRREFLLDEPEDDDESRFAHETSLQLARTFRRGSEEITLARRLHDHASPQLSGVRMEEKLGRATTPDQRLHIARKLGVGRGEMDLAVKLRTIRSAEKKEGVTP